SCLVGQVSLRCAPVTRRQIRRPYCEEPEMRLKVWIPVLAAVAGLAPGGTARASHCGAVSNPAACCAPDQLCPPVRYRVCYHTVFEERSCVRYRPVYTTVMKECRYTVCRPVYEQHVRTHRYTVCRPVWESYDVVRKYTV